MDKRGISEVIITVLIILIAIAAILLVWQFLKPSLQDSAGGINGDRILVSLEVQKNYVKINQTSGLASIRIKRATGEGNLVAIKFIIENGTNSVVLERPAKDFAVLGDKTFDNLNFSGNLTNITKITIVPAIQALNGKLVYGIASDAYDVTGKELGNIVSNTICIQESCPGSECGTIYNCTAHITQNCGSGCSGTKPICNSGEGKCYECSDENPNSCGTSDSLKICAEGSWIISSCSGNGCSPTPAPAHCNSCTPRNCIEQGKVCGPAPNGNCGDTLDCGPCAPGQNCNATGQCITTDLCTPPGAKSLTCFNSTRLNNQTCQSLSGFLNWSIPIYTDCPSGGYTGNSYCIGNDINRNYLYPICNINGMNSNCGYNMLPKFNQTCVGGCANGICIQIQTINNCQVLSQPNTIYKINNDITRNDLTGPCINITADHVTLDCQNHKIRSDDDVDGVYSNKQYTTVKNCDITANLGEGIGDNHGAIHFVSADYSNVIDSTLNSNFNGLLLAYTSNSNISGITANSNFNGIYLISSSKNTLSNIISDQQDATHYDPCGGITLTAASNNNILSDISTRGYTGGYAAGIMLYSSSNNNIIKKVSSNSNNQGIFSTECANNTFKDIIVDSNGYCGVYSQLSTRETYSNLTITNSQYGIMLNGNTNEIISDSRISSCGLDWRGIFSGNGIYITGTNTTIYNNYLNNVDNFYTGNPVTYTLNTSLQSRTNIIGGNKVGGNYWGNPSATGFSDTCTNRGDGICNSVYNLNGINKDYLPLAHN